MEIPFRTYYTVQYLLYTRLVWLLKHRGAKQR